MFYLLNNYVKCHKRKHPFRINNNYSLMGDFSVACIVDSKLLMHRLDE